MKNCTLKPELLVNFLKARMNNENISVSQEVAEHVKNCEKCKAIAENPRKAKIFIKLHDSATKLSEAANSIPQISKDVKIQFGQIWKLGKKYSAPSENEGRYVEKLAVEFGIVIDDNPEAILVAPVYMNYNKQEIDADHELVIDSSVTSLYMPLLVETWNIVEVSKNDFIKYYGELSQEYKVELYKKLTLNILGLFRYKELSKSVAFFRKSEKLKLEGIFSSPKTRESFFFKNVIKKIKEFLPTSVFSSSYSFIPICSVGIGSRCLIGFNPIDWICGSVGFTAADEDSQKMMILKEFFDKKISPWVEKLDGKLDAQQNRDSIILLRDDGKHEEFEIIVDEKDKFLSKDGMLELTIEDIAYINNKEFIIQLR